MKLVPIGPALKPASSTSLRPPSGVTAVGTYHGKVEVSMVQELRTSRNYDTTTDFKSGRLISRVLCCTKLHHSQRQRTKVLANAASEHSDDPYAFGVAHKIEQRSLGATLHAIYKFSKVYTLQGSALSIIAISLLAVQKFSELTPSFFIGLLKAIVGGLLANLYTVAINQLSDIEIDKVNKPYLPLASGELSVKTGILLTWLYVILGICLGLSTKSWPLKLGLLLWYAVGTVYSVHIPLLRWKRDPILAAVCIWALQALIPPIFFYLHAQTYIYGRQVLLSKHAIFVCGIMSIYAIVAALFKDIPDVEGDAINGINSLASQVGKKRVFWICIWLLEMAYGMAILIGLSSTRFWARSIMVIAHSILGFILWREANLVDLESNEAIESFYMLIWKLYGTQSLLTPVLRF